MKYASKSKKSTKKYAPKKTYSRPTRALANKNIVQMGTGFPKQMIMSHKYCEDVSFASTLGGIGKYKFCCNGIFDPNLTGSGHQPFGTDQNYLLYNHSFVLSSKIKFTILPQVGAASFAYGIMIDDDTTNTFTVYDQIAEQSLSKVRYCPANNSSPRTLTMNWNAKKIFGGDILDNTSLKGTSTANPSEQSIYTIFIQSADGITTVTTQLMVEIIYTVQWLELKDLAQS